MADTSRRDALKIAGMGASGVLLASLTTSVASHAAPASSSPVLPPDHWPGREEVDAFLGDIAPGAHVEGYRVVDVMGIVSGGIPVTLESQDGEQFCVDVLRFDPSEPLCGIGEVSAVTVVLRNNGKGALPTHESHGLGAMALARAVAQRVRAGARVPAGLMTMSERSAHDARR